jgi:hypothetical protein
MRVSCPLPLPCCRNAGEHGMAIVPGGQAARACARHATMHECKLSRARPAHELQLALPDTRADGNAQHERGSGACPRRGTGPAQGTMPAAVEAAPQRKAHPHCRREAGACCCGGALRCSAARRSSCCGRREAAARSRSAQHGSIAQRRSRSGASCAVLLPRPRCRRGGKVKLVLRCRLQCCGCRAAAARPASLLLEHPPFALRDTARRRQRSRLCGQGIPRRHSSPFARSGRGRWLRHGTARCAL